MSIRRPSWQFMFGTHPSTFDRIAIAEEVKRATGMKVELIAVGGRSKPPFAEAEAHYLEAAEAAVGAGRGHQKPGTTTPWGGGR